MNGDKLGLSLSQQFNVAQLQKKIENASLPQIKGMLIDMYIAYLYQQNQYKTLIGHKWGMLDNESE